MARSLNLDKGNPNFPALKALTKMKYLDLQAAVIMRGMDFQDVVEGDYGVLSSFFIREHNNPVDRELLEDFDIWMDKQLEKKYEKNHPLRKYRRFSNIDEDENVNVKTRSLRKADVPKKKRVKKKRNKFNLFEGTKKAYTYLLANDLYDKMGSKYTVKELMKKFSNKLYSEVLKKFDNASEKSVKIWAKRALNELEKKES